MTKQGIPHFINGSFKANAVPAKINRAMETHLMSKFFIINFTLIRKCVIISI
jgi:hypothetical protein